MTFRSEKLKEQNAPRITLKRVEGHMTCTDGLFQKDIQCSLMKYRRTDHEQNAPMLTFRF